MLSKIILGTALLFLVGCNASQTRTGSPRERVVSKILLLIKNPTQPALVTMDPMGSGAQTAGLLGGLIGGGIYAASIHRSEAEVLPLQKKLNACSFPEKFETQIKQDLSAHPGWTVVSGSEMEPQALNSLRRYLIEDKATAEEKRQTVEIADKQGITHAVVVDLKFHGMLYARDAKSLYNVMADGRLFDLARPEKSIWRKRVNARTLANKPAYVTLSTEIQRNGAQVCAQLIKEGVDVSHAFAADLGVSTSSFKTD